MKGVALMLNLKQLLMLKTNKEDKKHVELLPL